MYRNESKAELDSGEVNMDCTQPEEEVRTATTLISTTTKNGKCEKSGTDINT